MSTLGVVTQKDNQFVAQIATYDLGKRYRFAGPLRGDDEQLAYQDLCYIRAAAELELILNYSVLPEQSEQIGLRPDRWRRVGQTF